MKLSELISQLSLIPEPENKEVIIECNGFCPVIHVDYECLGYQAIEGTARGNVGYTTLNDELRSAGYTDEHVMSGEFVPCVLLTPVE